MVLRKRAPHRALVCLILTSAVARGATGGERSYQGVPEIERLAWLQGCWEGQTPRGTIEEHWMAPRARSMLGISRTVRGDSVTSYELVVIRQQEGRLAYEAHPAGQPPAVFVARTVTDSGVVFENPDHDFPQRVGYRPVGRDSLLAWIEGTARGRTRRVEFPYHRAPCPEPLRGSR